MSGEVAELGSSRSLFGNLVKKGKGVSKVGSQITYWLPAVVRIEFNLFRNDRFLLCLSVIHIARASACQAADHGALLAASQGSNTCAG